jgi:hypothetical protein
VQIPLVVSGVDLYGRSFTEPAQTIVIARYGAKIICRRKLAPQLEITVHSLMTDEDAEARVVGCISEDPVGVYYGIELLEADATIWGIEFPPFDPNDTAVGRVLLECIACRRREITRLNEFEAEVLSRSLTLWRQCKRCADLTLWKETWLQANEDLPEPDKAPASKPEPPKRTRNDRLHPRLEIQMEALIRDPLACEEMVKTLDVSRGGFRFKSRKYYAADWSIEVALPASLGGANIFSAAKVKYILETPGEDEKTYGVAYTLQEDISAESGR